MSLWTSLEMSLLTSLEMYTKEKIETLTKETIYVPRYLGLAKGLGDTRYFLLRKQPDDSEP